MGLRRFNAAYLDTLNGRVPPDQGLILSLYRHNRYLLTPFLRRPEWV